MLKELDRGFRDVSKGTSSSQGEAFDLLIVGEGCDRGRMRRECCQSWPNSCFGWTRDEFGAGTLMTNQPTIISFIFRHFFL